MTLQTSSATSYLDGDPVSPGLFNAKLDPVYADLSTVAGLTDSIVGYDYIINVRDPAYGARGDGSTNDLTAIRAAISALPASRGVLLFPPGDYYLGTCVADDHLLSFQGQSNLLVVGYGARLTCQTTATASGAANVPSVLRFISPVDVVIAGLSFTDTGSDITLEWRGASAITLHEDTGTSGNVTIRDCSATSMDYLLLVTGTGLLVAYNSAYRLRRIAVVDCQAKNCYYGLNFQNQGDEVRVRNFRAWNVRIAYFPYGVQNHDVDVIVRSDAGASGANGAIEISRSQWDTAHLRVRAVFHGTCVHPVHVAMPHISDIAGSIHDVDVDLRFADYSIPIATKAFQVAGYTGAGASLSTTSLHVWSRIRLAGDLDFTNTGGSLAPIQIVSQQSIDREIRIDDSLRPWVSSSSTYPGFWTSPSIRPTFYGTLGSSVTPSYAFSSESSLGWWRSGASTMALSFGTLNLAQGRLVSVRTQTSLASSGNIVPNEWAVVVGVSAATLAIRSGVTTYLWTSSATTNV